jgi:hypothetical protein
MIKLLKHLFFRIKLEINFRRQLRKNKYKDPYIYK